MMKNANANIRKRTIYYFQTIVEGRNELYRPSLVTKKNNNQVLHKQNCTAIEDGKRLEISDLGRTEIILSCHCRAALVFTSHMQNRFSHDATHLKDGIATHDLEILGQFLESVLSVNFLNQCCRPFS